MVRYHLGLDGSGANRAASACGRCSACSPTSRSPASTARPCPGAAAVELGHNFSLVHDDIEDRDVERRHRATLWTVYGVPQAINTGDTLFTLSRMALHRLTELGFSDAKVLPLMRLYDETCLALCEGQFMDIWGAEHDEHDVGRVLLRHDRPQDGGADRRVGPGRSDAGHRRRGGHRRATARFGWSLGIAFQLNDDLLGIWGDEQTTGKEPSDLAKHKKTLPVIYALERAPDEDRARLPQIVALTRARRRRTSTRRGRILERCGAREYTRSGRAR